MKEQQQRGNGQPENPNEQNKQLQASAVRFVYNISPATKQMALSSTIPNAVHYTPFKSDLDPEIYYYTQQLTCRKCKSFINLHCQIHKNKKLWICCICKEHNTLPQKLPQSITNLQTYDVTTSTTISTKKQRVYLFVIDLCISLKQMKSIQASLVSFINIKSKQKQGNIVNKFGLITYSKFIYCYDFCSVLNTTVCIGAEKNYDTNEIKKLLAIQPQNYFQSLNKYFINITPSGLTKIEKRLKKIKPQGNICHENDPQKRCRNKRAYGQALNIALSLNQLLANQSRIVSFIGGPCTYGVGQTISTDFKYQMRSIEEYQTGATSEMFQFAVQFYKLQKEKALGKKAILDLYIFSTDETGLAEMYDLVRYSGGLLVLGEQFAGDDKIFQKSFNKAYLQSEDNELVYSLSSACMINIKCSKDILINGALGLCKPVQQATNKQFVSQKSIGFGDTNTWYGGSMDCYKTITFLYELSSSKAFESSYFLQFKTIYNDYWGIKKTRITTTKKQFDTNTAIIADNFDQDAAIVTLARWYLYKFTFEPKINLTQWIDKILVRWATYFASFTKGNIQSFVLPEKMKFFPQYIYHFRRNCIFRKLGLSLDELLYHSHALNRQTVQHCIPIIQPALVSYTIQKPYPSPVRLQQQEMKNSVILLLDTYFHILLWQGQNIQYWQTQQYHKQKQYQHVKILLQAPNQDIPYLLNNRFPIPNFYKVYSGHSKQRILKSKISPSQNGIHHENCINDDKSLYHFMKVLIQIIVNGKFS